jgi:hypothetical protein
MKTIVKDQRTVGKVRTLYEQGLSINMIVRKLRISQPTISRIIKLHDLQRLGPVIHGSAATTSARHKALKEAVSKNNENPERTTLRWEPSEEAWLIEQEKVLTVQEAALHLKRSTDAIRVKMRQLGVKLKHTVSWSSADDEYIKANFQYKSINDIAKHLGRGYHGVRKRALRLGLGLVSDQVTHRVTTADIALRMGVTEAVVARWVTLGYIATERVGRWHVTDDITVTKWLESGHILRADRSALDYRDRTMYDRVRAAHYRICDVWALDIPALRHIHCYARDEEGRRLIPKALHVSQGKDPRHGYYRKTDIWAWCYYVGHALPDHIADPDIADVYTAWLTEFVTTWELRKHFSSNQQNYWITHLGFPHSVIHSRTYRRAEVIAWLRAHGKPDIAHKLTRGAVLCYDDLIRERHAREGRTM